MKCPPSEKVYLYFSTWLTCFTISSSSSASSPNDNRLKFLQKPIYCWHWSIIKNNIHTKNKCRHLKIENKGKHRISMKLKMSRGRRRKRIRWRPSDASWGLFKVSTNNVIWHLLHVVLAHVSCKDWVLEVTQSWHEAVKDNQNNDCSPKIKYNNNNN